MGMYAEGRSHGYICSDFTRRLDQDVAQGRVGGNGSEPVRQVVECFCRMELAARSGRALVNRQRAQYGRWRIYALYAIS